MSEIGTEELLELVDVWGYSADVQAAVAEALAREQPAGPMLSRYGGQRPSKVAALERLAVELFGTRHALAVNSGTAALTCAYLAAGIGPGQEVIIPAYSFIATAASVVTAGAIPIIADVDQSLTLDPADVQRKISPRTTAIVAVHMNGACADLASLRALADERRLYLIEDTAQACGASYRGRRLGTIGHLGTFSLSSYKVTGGGEAGMVLTDDPELHMRAMSVHDVAGGWRANRCAEEQPGEAIFCSYNFRMSELEGAVNLAQLRKMPAQVARYNAAKQKVTSRLRRFADITPQLLHDRDGEIGNLLVFFAPDAQMAARVAKALREERVPAIARGTSPQRDWHLAAYWQQILERKSPSADGWPWTCERNLASLAPLSAPRALELINRAVFVPIGQRWTDSDCENVAAVINEVLLRSFKPSAEAE